MVGVVVVLGAATVLVLIPSLLALGAKRETVHALLYICFVYAAVFVAVYAMRQENDDGRTSGDDSGGPHLSCKNRGRPAVGDKSSRAAVSPSGRRRVVNFRDACERRARDSVPLIGETTATAHGTTALPILLSSDEENRAENHGTAVCSPSVGKNVLCGTGGEVGDVV